MWRYTTNLTHSSLGADIGLRSSTKTADCLDDFETALTLTKIMVVGKTKFRIKKAKMSFGGKTQFRIISKRISSE